MTVISPLAAETEGSADRYCDSCGRSFVTRSPLSQADRDDWARVNGWHIGADETFCPACRQARLEISDP
ncbi:MULTISPECIES: hypothetical protein [Gordonia]|uniref:Uncharacterized protein n=1 Tax=Gordonia amicalis TaxID=89053 RepID=A0AAE4R3F2_9ACTN|nr:MULTISPECIES: hypothetical protein [Gordonia]ATD70211.1 hypothetical protein CNO18_07955 [Gordonia sp. 1D]MBA5849160.1 hypothetical protein [Gordonia amicalis]MCZ4578163.1 hypothetical protein [Gordonia amicalis]MCZ4652738.1 hypothetical protein [Gordonia amicalis]MDJ0454118.1 hypothetical protein [Gordonia amicalis]